MTVVDAEGRLFGRWNFVDALVVILGVALIPLGYAAYILFRTPSPRLLAVEPAEIVQTPEMQVKIVGENLRPYLRVSFGTAQGRTFLFENTSSAVVDLNPLPPGTYDVILYDYGQERHRLPNALTIKAPIANLPTTEVFAVGRFLGLTKEAAAAIKVGALSTLGQLTTVAAPTKAVPRVFSSGIPIELPAPEQFEVAAIAKLPCIIKITQGYPECGGADFALRSDYMVGVPGGPGGSRLTFQIDQVYSVDPVEQVTVRVRFNGPAEAVALIAPGDTDTVITRNPYALGAVVKSVNRVTGEGELEVRAQRLPSGWWYGSDTLRVAGVVPVRTDKYAVGAQVIAIDAK